MARFPALYNLNGQDRNTENSGSAEFPAPKNLIGRDPDPENT